MADKFYLWSRLRNGGDVQVVKDPLGRERKVVSNRNTLQPGEVVTQDSLGADDAQWAEWVDSGVVRNYPYPEVSGRSNESPVDFLRRTIRENAQSEEEQLVAAVQGLTNNDAELVNAAAKDAPAAKDTASK